MSFFSLIVVTNKSLFSTFLLSYYRFKESIYVKNSIKLTLMKHTWEFYGYGWLNIWATENLQLIWKLSENTFYMYLSIIGLNILICNLSSNQR